MSGLTFAMVTTFYPPHHFGGDAVFVRRLTHALARRGHRVEVIHDVDAHRLLSTGGEPGPVAEPPGVLVHPLASRWGALSCLATHQLGRPVVHGRTIRRILAAADPDVTMFHNVSLVGGPDVLAWGRGVRLYMAHEHWLVCPTHVLWRHDREPCDRRECLRCLFHHRRPPQAWRWTGRLERRLESVDALISPSAFSAAKHREFGLERELEVIPYFLPDLDSGDEEEVDHPDDRGERPYFLYVGRLEKLKGLHEVIPHFREAPPADLWVVGQGGYEAELRRLAGGSPHVRFLGWRSPSRLRALYRRAVAAVVPSLCFETFGIVLLEAFRERTPVVARARGPLVEIVEESGGGLLFEDARSLAAALDRLAADRALGRRLGGAGRRALEERWVEGAVLDRYLDLVRRVAARRGHRRVVEALASPAP